MSITSFGFLALLFFGLLIYYIVPRGQWLVLLAMSLVFYYFAATPYTIVFLCISILTAYAAGGVCSDIEQATEKGRKRAAFAAILAVLINFGMWFALRGTDLWVSLSYRLSLVVPFVPRLRPLPVAAALGMGYYTLQVIGYILDCYWGTIKPQKNPVKLFLFVIFFPQLTTGPISRYSQLETLYERHRFSYENVAHGMQRILWGFLKKLVLAERVGILINGIWGNLPDYTGWWRWVALLLYPVQMYADFSGRGPASVYEGSGVPKPDLAAPGVQVIAPAPGGSYRAFSGTSFATPFVSGSAALLMDWGIVQGNDPYLYGEKVKAYLRRGARELPGYDEWPNAQLGYGILCLQDSLPRGV